MNTDKIYAEQIANKYSAKTASKVKKLKKLDAKANEPALITSLTIGITSSLVLGTGMSLAKGVIGKGTTSFIIGIVVGVLGIVGCSINYPIYKRIRENGRNKYASDIMKLANEIIEE